jgi:hypothetical protein
MRILAIGCLLMACDGKTADTAEQDIETEPASEADGENEDGQIGADGNGAPDLPDPPEELAGTADRLEEMIGNTDPADLTDPEMQFNITAPGSMLIAMGPVITLQFAQQFDPTMDCPAISGTLGGDDADPDAVVTGDGCTDASGVVYNGSFVYTATQLVFDGYSVTTPSEDCPGETTNSVYDGGYIYTGNDGVQTQTFIAVTVDSTELREDCTQEQGSIGILSTLTMEETDNGTLLNGEGSLATESEGAGMAWHFHTEDEVYNDDLCSSEPVSGTNTVASGDHVLVYTFDGETDCDEEPTQMMSLDGGEETEVEGVGCSTSTGGKETAIWMLLGLIGMRTRKR